MESYLQQPILRIVALAASGARHVAAPRRPLTIVVLCYGKGRPTAAGDEKHLQTDALIGLLLVSGCTGSFHDYSTAA